MFENSAAGLVMLAAEVTVTVTREEMHQPTLARYPVPPGGERRVAVELVWCTIGSGKHRGQRAIEVRMDGYRVGELTYLMSQRYSSLMSQVQAGGGRTGCEGVIERTARGLQITLRLPRDTDGVVPFPTATIPATPAAAAAASKKKSADRRATWIVAGAVVSAVLLLAGILGSGDDDPTSAPTANGDTYTATVEAPPTTTTTTTTTTPPPTTTTTTTVAPPPPPPVTQEPVVPPVVVEEPPPAPSGCDPNYSGCVPIASDVDCAGGSGNGPAYADGPVQVIGSDIYGLDRDNDGTACE